MKLLRCGCNNEPRRLYQRERTFEPWRTLGGRTQRLCLSAKHAQYSRTGVPLTFMSSTPYAISAQTKYLAAADPSLPALALQVTRLVDSYMLWIGTTELSPEDVSKAPSQGSLARDWACAMPAITVCFLQPSVQCLGHEPVSDGGVVP
jgi:Proteasome assembly chaperone 4